MFLDSFIQMLCFSAPPDPGFHQPDYFELEDDQCLDWDEYDQLIKLQEKSQPPNIVCPFIDWEAEESCDDQISPEDRPGLVCYSETSDEE